MLIVDIELLMIILFKMINKIIFYLTKNLVKENFRIKNQKFKNEIISRKIKRKVDEESKRKKKKKVLEILI